MLSMMTDSSVKFKLSQFMTALISHVLFMFFWVFAVPMMLCFTNMQFIINMGFWPPKNIKERSFMIFIVQTITSILWMTMWATFIKNRYLSDDEYQKLHAEPLMISIVLCLSRFM